MIFTSSIVFFLSINSILSKNTKSNRFILIPSCPESKPIPFINKHRYYFSSSSLSLSSSSSSSSLFPLNHLTFCEHQQQQTTSPSSSGFSLLYSLPHLLLTNTEDNHRSSSSSSNFNVTISSTSIMSTNESQLFDPTTTPNLFNSTSMPTNPFKPTQLFYLILLIGCISSGIFLIIIIYILIKYCNRDEGTYKIDESKNFPGKHLQIAEQPTKIPPQDHHRQKLLTTNDKRIDNTKEWYV